jgi:hypothetical protein
MSESMRCGIAICILRELHHSGEPYVMAILRQKMIPMRRRVAVRVLNE